MSLMDGFMPTQLPQSLEIAMNKLMAKHGAVLSTYPLEVGRLQLAYASLEQAIDNLAKLLERVPKNKQEDVINQINSNEVLDKIVPPRIDNKVFDEPDPVRRDINILSTIIESVVVSAKPVIDWLETEIAGMYKAHTTALPRTFEQAVQDLTEYFSVSVMFTHAEDLKRLEDAFRAAEENLREVLEPLEIFPKDAVRKLLQQYADDSKQKLNAVVDRIGKEVDDNGDQVTENINVLIKLLKSRTQWNEAATEWAMDQLSNSEA